jgi:hypothetical protein
MIKCTKPYQEEPAVKWCEEETTKILAAAKKQSRRIETLAKLEILKARAPARYVRLMYLEALHRAEKARKKG